jgi:hypothetical protein
MEEITIESIFGVKAGIVWEVLNKNGPSNIGHLVRTTSMSREEVYGALGWLGRENKISVEGQGRTMSFSLLQWQRSCDYRQIIRRRGANRPRNREE